MIVENAAPESLAQLFRALSHPFRLQLLRELLREEECVCHLAALFDKPQPYVSQQLAALREAGLIVDRREGKRVFYSLRDERVTALIDLAASIGGWSWSTMTEPRARLGGCACPKCF